MKSEKKLFLLDAFALIYRAYFAFAKNPRINSKGLDTSAIFGFTNSLVEVINKQKPTHLAVVFDTPKPTQRHVDYPEYKAQREAMPEGISNALPYIDQLLEAFNIPKLYKDGYEADDVIGTIAKKAEKAGFQVYMMTSDKDFAQLVSENIFMYRPGNKWQPTQVWGIEQVLEKFKINKVSQVIDFLAMMGDASDNVPGISGVGQKTAQKFISEFGSIEALFANTDKLQGKIKEKVISSKDVGLLSKKLVTIITDVPIEFDEHSMKLNILDKNKVENIFKELEFRNVMQRLFREDNRTSTEEKIIDPPAINDINNNQFDLFSQKQQQESNSFNLETSNYSICNSPDELLDFASKNSTKTHLFFQTISSLSTENKKIIGISISFDSSEMFFVSLNNKDAESYLETIKKLLEDENYIKIAYDLKEQMKLFYSQNIELNGNFFDVAVAHYILHPDLRHDLELIADSYLSVNLDNDFTAKRGKIDFSVLSLESTSKWSNERVNVIQKLHPLFLKELDSTKSLSLFNEIEMPLLKVLCKMEIEGINLDVDLLKKYSEELKFELDENCQKIYKLSN